MIPVKDVMRREVISVRLDTPVPEVARILDESRITGMPVLDPEDNVVGIVSELDVFTKRGRVAGDIMSPHVIAVTEETGIDEAARILAGERIRRLPVLAGGKMVGLLSRSDVLTFFNHSLWTCSACGHSEHGLQAPERCDMCGGTAFGLEVGAPGS